jgi:hypothetical protein
MLTTLKDIHAKSDRSAADAEHFIEDPLDWCIDCLTTNPDAERTIDHSRMFEFLDEHLARASAPERARMDEILYRKLSDLAAFNEMLVMVRAHRPRATPFSLEEITKSDTGRVW